MWKRVNLEDSKKEERKRGKWRGKEIKSGWHLNEIQAQIIYLSMLLLFDLSSLLWHNSFTLLFIATSRIPIDGNERNKSRIFCSLPQLTIDSLNDYPTADNSVLYFHFLTQHKEILHRNFHTKFSLSICLFFIPQNVIKFTADE